MPMTMPKPDAESKAYFESVLPKDPRVNVRPMFGNVAGFVNGNMFMGLFGNDLFVRLDDDDRAELMQEPGAGVMEPIPGRPMKEYVVVPQEWRDQPDKVNGWIDHSLDWVSQMPEKKPKKRK